MPNFLKGLLGGVKGGADAFIKTKEDERLDARALKQKSAELALQQAMAEKKRQQDLQDDILKIALTPIFKGLDKESVQADIPDDFDFGSQLAGAGLNIPPEFAMTLKSIAKLRPQKKRGLDPFNPDAFVGGGAGGIGGPSGGYVSNAGGRNPFR